VLGLVLYANKIPCQNRRVFQEIFVFWESYKKKIEKQGIAVWVIEVYPYYM